MKVKERENVGLKLNIQKTKIMASSPKGDGTPLQYSCLENPTDRGAW